MDSVNWEQELRDKLNRELEEGLYKVGIPGSAFCYTGKQGKIDFEIALVHEAKKFIKNSNKNLEIVE